MVIHVSLLSCARITPPRTLQRCCCCFCFLALPPPHDLCFLSSRKENCRPNQKHNRREIHERRSAIIVVLSISSATQAATPSPCAAATLRWLAEPTREKMPSFFYYVPPPQEEKAVPT